ncbi:MAG: elongation factor Ts [Gammaproteobacteria bacterium]|nr:elongation factor Ts [Gammaproteobacteria bacterium]
MQISAAAVKELRERSGAGMMECKNALVETGGDLEAALEHLRKSGAAKAAKKAGRIAAEGTVVVAERAGQAVVVEINSETDFVANDDNFSHFSTAVGQALLEHSPADVDALGALVMPGAAESIEAARQQLVLKIGENISIRRFEQRKAEAGQTLGAYRHGKRIGVLVTLEGGTPELAKDIAMHVAATNPTCISEEEVPAELLAKEKEIRVAQAATSGKPADIVEKMVSGQLRKFVAEITLLGQAFVKDPDTTVGKLLGGKAKVLNFVRYEVGEGIEKKTVDFAEEVKAQARAAD